VTTFSGPLARCRRTPFTLLVLMLPLGVAASSLSVTQGTYKLGSAPALGERLPIDGPVFHVYAENADGYGFVGKTNEGVRFKFTATAACSGTRRPDRVSLEIAGTSVSKDMDRNRGGFERERIQVSVGHSRRAAFNAVKACNDMLRTLTIETALSKRELIAKGYTLRAEDVFEVKGMAFCTSALARGHTPADRAPADVWVSCEPNPKLAKTEEEKPDRGRPPMPLIRRLELAADPAHQLKVCPASVRFTGSIVANRKGTVRYRTVANDGSASPVFTLQFDGPASKPIGRWSQTFPAPPPARLAGGEQESEAPTYQGWRRIEIVEPAGVPPSARAEYTVICTDGPLVPQGQPAQPVPGGRPPASTLKAAPAKPAQ